MQTVVVFLFSVEFSSIVSVVPWSLSLSAPRQIGKACLPHLVTIEKNKKGQQFISSAHTQIYCMNPVLQSVTVIAVVRNTSFKLRSLVLFSNCLPVMQGCSIPSKTARIEVRYANELSLCSSQVFSTLTCQHPHFCHLNSSMHWKPGFVGMLGCIIVIIIIIIIIRSIMRKIN